MQPSTSDSHVQRLGVLALIALQSTQVAPGASSTVFDATITSETSISEKNEPGLTQTLHRSSEQQSSFTSNSKSVCLFCNKIEKRIGQRRLYVSYPQSNKTTDAITEMAKKLNDIQLLAKLEKKENIAYHLSCFSSYQIQMKRKTEEPSKPSHWHFNRQLHKTAFNSISALITTEIIQKKTNYVPH